MSAAMTRRGSARLFRRRGRPGESARPVSNSKENSLMTTHESSGTPAVHTLAEAAAILRVKESWLERQAAARKIPFTMLGGAYRFTAEHLTAIVRIYEKTPDQESSGTPAS